MCYKSLGGTSMKTLDNIRDDLKEIRYYYSRKKMFDDAFKLIGANSVVAKAQLYNEICKTASPQLFDIYYQLYIKGYTQEGIASEIGYSSKHIQKLNKQLLLFIQREIKAEIP